MSDKNSPVRRVMREELRNLALVAIIVAGVVIYRSMT